jgi:hypothetical protein
MIIEVLAADVGIAVRIRIVSLAQDASVRDIVCKKIAELVYAIWGCLSLVPMSV